MKPHPSEDRAHLETPNTPSRHWVSMNGWGALTAPTETLCARNCGGGREFSTRPPTAEDIYAIYRKTGEGRNLS